MNNWLEGITPVIKKGSGCDYHRIYLPLTYLGFPVEEWEKNPPEINEQMAKTKLLIFNRTPQLNFLTVMANKAKYGFKILVDIDDHWDLYSHHEAKRSYDKSGAAENMLQWIRNADFVTVTTEKLRKAVLCWNSNVQVIPNALPIGFGQFIPKPKEFYQGPARFIYTGGASHFWDLLQIQGTMKYLVKYLPECYYLLAGYSKNESHRETWDRMESIFSADKKLKGYMRRLEKDVFTYMEHYNSADVALAPLQYNVFNTYKSNLKVLEAGCKQIPIITSWQEPYENDLDKGFVIYANRNDDWSKYMIRLAKDTNYRLDKGMALYEHVKANYDLIKVNEIRSQVYQMLMQ
jgi:glycosyltransferase involved in cell wall biosynthesis